MEDDLIVRDYKYTDYQDVILIWEELDLARKERGDNNEVILRTLKLGGKLILLCYKNKIIGTSWLTTDGRRLYLHHFGIKKQYQGKKYSYLLIEASLKYAKKLDLQIKLEVNKNNFKAISLYKKVGFSYLGDYNVYIIRDVQNI